MGISPDIEAQIKQAAKIADVIADAGYTLQRRGTTLQCLCPFHEDRHIGSFVVNVRNNYYKCFSCKASGDPVKFVREYYGKTYVEALRYLAAMYGIYIDNEPVPTVTKREPRQPVPPTVMAYWDAEIIKPNMHHENNLLTWMLSLPWQPEHLRNLKNAIELYCVGTSLKGYTQGWAMFPQIDEQLRLRDVKFMAYNPDGHRVKDAKGNGKADWMRAMMERNGQFNSDTYHVEHCLFGLHLAKVFQKAEICIVESEKSAILCSAFTDPSERLWLATGGKQFKPEQLRPLIDANRYIVLYPDIDGYGEWKSRMNAIGYPRMSMSNKVTELHIAADGPKADIADIMVRMMHGITETEAEKVARRLHLTRCPEPLEKLINKFDLKVMD